jgi:RNA polymerase sigma-70 factor (ECF subfamily)
VGDRDEFETCYASRAPALVAQLYFATGSLEEAQDCLQEAWARAWVRWPSLVKGGDDPAAWVHTVAWRLAVSGWRRRKRYLVALRRHGQPPDEPGPSPDAVAVRDALSALPMGHRAVLVLHYYESLTAEEIGRVLDLPPGAVRTRLSRARAALRRELGDVTGVTPGMHVTGTNGATP